MFGLGSRTFYAILDKSPHPILFNFESKVDRDYFVAHMNGARRISSYDAMNCERFLEMIRVEASCGIGANKERKKRIKIWHENK